MATKSRRSGREVLAGAAGVRAWARRHAFSLLSSIGSLARHPLASGMTFAVLAIALALPLALHVALLNLERMSLQWERLDTLSVFVQPGVDEYEVDRLVSRLSHWPEVLAVDPISPAQGLDELGLQLGLDDLADVVEDNPLPWVLELTAAPAADREQLQQRLAQESQISTVLVDLQWLERLDAMGALLEQLVSLLAVLLAFGVAVIIGNTIRLDIQNRHEEIEVMALVGATGAFIRRPFLYTGFWYGCIGGLLGWAIVAGGLFVLAEPMRALSATYMENFVLLGPDVQVIAWLVPGSGLFGLLGAWLVVAQHLRRIDP